MAKKLGELIKDKCECDATGKKQTVELDCPPGSPRPDDLIGGILEGTGLKEREPVSKFFGNWTWDYSDIPEEKWKRVKEIVAPKIKKLYANGLIRYGSW